MLMLSCYIAFLKFLNKDKNHDINKKEEAKYFSHWQPF